MSLSVVFSLISDNWYFNTKKNAFKKRKVELSAWRLEKKLRDNWFFTKQEFLAKSFARPTLSTIEYSLGHLLVISYSRICFRTDWVHVYKYRKIGRNYITAKSKNLMNMLPHFNHCRKKRMLITRLKLENQANELPWPRHFYE